MATTPSSSPQGIQTASFKGISAALNLPAVPSHPSADPARHPMDAFLLAAAEQVAAALGIDFDKAWEGTQLHAKADIIVTVPRFRLPGKPVDVAQKVVDAFKPNVYLEAASNERGFVWFTCNTSTLTALTLGTIHELSRGRSSGSWAGEDLAESSGLYGTNATGAGKQMIVEFSSPNIAKPFHAGHLRSTIIGAFIANLYEANGWKVERWNYLGDWGKQFGLLAVGWEKYGDEALLKEDAVKHLYDVYVKINKTAEAEPEIHDAARAYFKAMEDDDEHALGLWKKFRDLSIEKYKETYARLNVHFDVYSGESQVSKQSIATALDHIRSSDYVTKADNGALLIDLTKYKLEKAVIERKDGTPLYVTRDIGEAKQRWDRFVAQRGDGMGFDKMIYVVASQQDLHLAQFFKVLELIGYEWAQPAAQRLLHINFGMVLGMSTRKGTAVFLEHILDEAKENMHNVMRSNEDKYAQVENPELTADVLGMTAVKVQDMGANRINNYQFDWSRMLSFEGDTGPYMQYNHVRLCSVERRVADLDGVALPSVLDPSSLRLDLLAEPKAREIIMLLAQWPETVRSNLKDLQPSTIVHFCFRLCHALSSAWEVLIVRKQDKDVALARLFLFRCSKDVLSAAMRLLTIQPLQRM